jgi:hypothetical protein
MKRIETFEAEDGTKFDTEQECLAYENSCKSERAIEKLITEFTSDFSLQLKLGRFFQLHKIQIRDILNVDTDGWISNENNNNDFPPISGNTIIDVMYRDGTVDTGEASYWEAIWCSTDFHPKDIVKYRVFND